MSKFCDWFLTNWYNLIHTKVELGDVLLYGLCISLLIALIACFVTDAPVAYLNWKGSYYRIGSRSVRIIEDECND